MSVDAAREQILGRIRAALSDVPAGEPPAWERQRDATRGDRDRAAAGARGEDDRDSDADYERGATLDAAAAVELFAQRCGEYRATVTRCGATAQDIAAAVRAACERQGLASLVVPEGLDEAWVPDFADVRRDDPPLTAAQLDGSDGVLTGCALAIAQTGTIVLDAGPGQGRRALTLLPDAHICVVLAEQVLDSVPQAIAVLADTVRSSRRPLTLISGPSATSDIELKRVEGVHGPRRLEIVLAG